MRHRLAIVFAAVLSTAAPAPAQEPAATASTGAGPGSGASTAAPVPAQEPAAGIELGGSAAAEASAGGEQAQEPAAGTEFEFGGGWFQWNPLGVEDFIVSPSGPSVDLAWTTWRSGRRGLAAGISAVPWRVDLREHNDGVERAFPLYYAYVAYRWRWRTGGRQTVHFGLGGGALAWSETTEVRRWNPEIPAWDYFGETEGRRRVFPWYHAEVFLTRPVRDGLAVRFGVRFTPLLYLPLTAQPAVMGVWRF